MGNLLDAHRLNEEEMCLNNEATKAFDIETEDGGGFKVKFLRSQKFCTNGRVFAYCSV